MLLLFGRSFILFLCVLFDLVFRLTYPYLHISYINFKQMLSSVKSSRDFYFQLSGMHQMRQSGYHIVLSVSHIQPVIYLTK